MPEPLRSAIEIKTKELFVSVTATGPENMGLRSSETTQVRKPPPVDGLCFVHGVLVVENNQSLSPIFNRPLLRCKRSLGQRSPEERVVCGGILWPFRLTTSLHWLLRLSDVHRLLTPLFVLVVTIGCFCSVKHWRRMELRRRIESGSIDKKNEWTKWNFREC